MGLREESMEGEALHVDERQVIKRIWSRAKFFVLNIVAVELVACLMGSDQHSASSRIQL